VVSLKHKKWIILCAVVVVIAVAIGSRSLRLSNLESVVGVIITRGGPAYGYIYASQLYAVEDDFSFFDAFGVTDGVAYFIVASDQQWARWFISGATVDESPLRFATSNVRAMATSIIINTQMQVYVTPASHLRHSEFNFITIVQDASGRMRPTSSSGIGVNFITEGEVRNFALWDFMSNISVNMHIKYEPVSVVVAQMGAEHNLIAYREYAPGAVPHEYLIEEGTAYIVVEARRQSPSGEILVARNIYNRDEAIQFHTYSAGLDRVLNRHITHISW